MVDKIILLNCGSNQETKQGGYGDPFLSRKMDISVYIAELLLTHECVIIPGFGALLANYKPADIHPTTHVILPPTKAITFNRNLQHNDGLLVNFVAERQGLSFDEAKNVVSNWVGASKSLLKSNEEVSLRKIGRCHNDIEGNTQFYPDETVNYLKSSFGLKAITVAPVIRGKQIDFTDKFKDETKQRTTTARKPWRMAALLLILIMAGAIAQLMWMGVEIKGLNLDEAGVLSFITKHFGSEPNIQPLPIEVEAETLEAEEVATDTTFSTAEDDTALALAENIKVEESQPDEKQYVIVKEQREYTPANNKYFVIIGAFIEEKNIAAATARLQERFPDSVILIQKGKRLTKVGYSVGNNFRQAVEKLKEVQTQDDSTYWLYSNK